MMFIRSLIISFLLLTLSACDPNSAGSFDRKQMESLVIQVRRQQFEGKATFHWQEVAGTATLVTDERQQQVWALRDQNQNLTVVILTRAGGHYGAGGFAYADTPFVRSLSQETAPRGGYTLDLPGPLTAAYPRRQIDAHWWPVFDSID